MIKTFIKDAHWTYWFFVIIVFAVLSPFILSSLKYLYNGATIKYTKYENISLTVNKEYVDGKFNKYISIKDKNNICYIEYCGFPKAGKYHIKEMTFIEIDEVPFMLKNCLNSTKCFYNLSNAFIEKRKEYNARQSKGILFMMVLAIFLLLYRGWFAMNKKESRRQNGYTGLLRF